jgi:hypothetical protein
VLSNLYRFCILLSLTINKISDHYRCLKLNRCCIFTSHYMYAYFARLNTPNVIFVGPLINGPDKKLGLIHRDYRIVVGQPCHQPQATELSNPCIWTNLNFLCRLVRSRVGQPSNIGNSCRPTVFAVRSSSSTQNSRWRYSRCTYRTLKDRLIKKG